jgi:hypothetical protein
VLINLLFELTIYCLFIFQPFCIEKGFRFSQFYEQLAAIQCLNCSKCKSAHIPQSFPLETLCVSCIICKLKDLRPAMKTVVGTSRRLSRRFSSSPPRVRFPASHYADVSSMNFFFFCIVIIVVVNICSSVV